MTEIEPTIIHTAIKDDDCFVRFSFDKWFVWDEVDGKPMLREAQSPELEADFNEISNSNNRTIRVSE